MEEAARVMTYKGIEPLKYSEITWRAYVQVGGKKVSLGTSSDKEEAARTRDR